LGEETLYSRREVAGHPRYWWAITLRLGNFFAFFSITPPPLSLVPTLQN